MSNAKVGGLVQGVVPWLPAHLGLVGVGVIATYCRSHHLMFMGEVRLRNIHTLRYLAWSAYGGYVQVVPATWLATLPCYTHSAMLLLPCGGHLHVTR